MNYFSAIRPPAGQIPQPQSCAFLHGDDWMWSILTGGLCRLHVGGLKWNRTPWTPLSLNKAGQFYYQLRFSCVAAGTSLCGLLCRGKKGRFCLHFISDESNTAPAGESAASSSASEEPSVPGTTEELVSCETPVNCSDGESVFDLNDPGTWPENLTDT
ncbi:hypothetical protein AVEN_255209-1 [Araneus ventricosus]|uniref:Uncharacterized protein n=1 Tax=Araneus ventricosus TaxID=182803 RepID=A0A4Y2BA30_ARAVE|nr:hypothetical protein AVEN_255209-1 [Araneus ventricosus]